MKTETKVKINKVASDLVYRFKTHDIGTQAAALSWFLLQSSIPMLMVLVTVVSRILKDNVDMIKNLVDFLPQSSQSMVMGVIDTMIINSQSASVTIITIIFALWSATKGVNKLIESINKAYGLQVSPNTIKQRIFSILYTLIFIVMVVFILVSQIYGPSILYFIRDNVLTRLSDKAFGGAFDNVISTLTSPLFRIIVTLVPLLIISVAVSYTHLTLPTT